MRKYLLIDLDLIKHILKFYNPLALDAPSFPPDNPEQLKNFYGVPTSLNVVDVPDTYSGDSGKYIILK